MSDFLTRRGSTWHFVRRVPAPFVSLDPRGIVRQSTRIRIADDRTGRRAARIAHKLNEELEIFWHGLSHGQDAAQANAYDAARRRARSLGFDYRDSAQLLVLPLERCLERLTASSGTTPASGTGWPVSGVAPSSSPRPSAWWTSRSLCSPVSPETAGSETCYLS